MKSENKLHNRNHEILSSFSIDYQDDDIVIVNSMEFKTEPEPMRVPRNVFYLCYSGNVDIETPEGLYSLRAGDSFVCPTGTFVRVREFSPETKFSAMSLTDRIIHSLLNTNVHVWNNIVYVMKERFIPAAQGGDDELRQKLGWHFTEIMRTLLSQPERPFRKEMIYLMLEMALLSFCARYEENDRESALPEDNDSRVTQSKIIFAKFMELLQNEPVKHRPVYYYSEKLCITSKYLSYVCKSVSGKSASEFIQSSVVGEIMHYLDNTTLSIKEISCRLGFPNISFFGKYVKAHLGLSPTKYRR